MLQHICYGYSGSRCGMAYIYMKEQHIWQVLAASERNSIYMRAQLQKEKGIYVIYTGAMVIYSSYMQPMSAGRVHMHMLLYTGSRWQCRRSSGASRQKVACTVEQAGRTVQAGRHVQAR